MKLFLCTLSILSVLGGSTAMAKTVLIDFGAANNSNTFTSPWNVAGGKNPTLSSDRETDVLKYSDGTNSTVKVTYKAGSALLVSPPSSNSTLTNLTAQQAYGTHGLAMWNAAHGSALTDARIQKGWEEHSLLSVGNLVDPGSINIGGFKANSGYTVSAAFTVSGLANILSFKNAPVTLQGSNFTVSHAYLSGCNGELIDLLQVGSVELAGLLAKGTFMLTWQFTTSSSFNTSSTINMNFAQGLLGLGGNYGISALAVTDGTPNLPVPTIPEPSSALLSIFGLAGLALKRRRK